MLARIRPWIHGFYIISLCDIMYVQAHRIGNPEYASANDGGRKLSRTPSSGPRSDPKTLCMLAKFAAGDRTARSASSALQGSASKRSPGNTTRKRATRGQSGNRDGRSPCHISFHSARSFIPLDVFSHLQMIPAFFPCIPDFTHQ